MDTKLAPAELDRHIRQVANRYLTGDIDRLTFLQWFVSQELATPLALNVAALITSSTTPPAESVLKEMLGVVLWRSPRAA